MVERSPSSSAKGGRGASSTRSRDKAVADALAGVVGSLVALWVFYPIDVWKTRHAASSSSSNAGVEGAAENNNKHIPEYRQDNQDQRACTAVIAPETLSANTTDGLYAGWLLKSLHTSTSSFCYFYLYSWIVSKYKIMVNHRYGGHGSAYGNEKMSSSTRLLLSATAAMLNTFFTLPLDGWSARVQTRHTTTSDGSTSRSNGPAASDVDKKQDKSQDSDSELMLKRSDSSISTASSVVEEVTSLWKGLIPSLLLCTNPAIHYTVFDTLKQRILSKSAASTKGSPPSLSVLEAFVLGMVSKFVATIATYPLIRAKIMIMVTSRTSVLGCLLEEYRRNGLKGWYRGCHLQLLHTLLKSAVLMVVRERITRTTRRLVLGQQETPNDPPRQPPT